MTKKAVCLISGGLDSAVTAFIAKKQGYELYALSFRYGQRHKKEISCAKKLVNAVGIIEHIVINIDLQKFGGSSLLSTSQYRINNHKLEDIGKKVPSTYVPARNTIFLSIALAYAEVIKATAIFIGVNSVDFSAYPDCRPDYIRAFQYLANLATERTVKGKAINIKAPLLYLSKSEIIKEGVKLNVPFRNTWSCYRGGTKACGRCDSCRLRIKGFKEAKVKDPISYITSSR